MQAKVIPTKIKFTELLSKYDAFFFDCDGVLVIHLQEKARVITSSDNLVA